MKMLKANNISKSVGVKQLFTSISFTIGEKERIGLIGVNGTGKSTLLKIIAGLEDSDQGFFDKANDYKISYLQQHPDLDNNLTIIEQVLSSDTEQTRIARDYESTLQKINEDPNNAKLQDQLLKLQDKMEQVDGWNVSTRAKMILSKLGLDDFHKKVGHLSGGQKKRVALAEVLMEPADLLLLDEPTNHLDYPMIEWLQEELVKLPCSILFVTHDRYFLDAISNRIFELADQKIYVYQGNYADYLESKAIREENEQHSLSKAKNLYRRELAWMKRGARARTTKQKARIQRFESLEQKVSQTKSNDELEINITGQRLGNDVIEIKEGRKTFSTKLILNNFNLLVKPGDRIGIAGKNGSGKSTLLNIIAGKEKLDDGVILIGQTVKMAYYKQESVDMDPNKRMIEYIRETKEHIRTKDGYLSAGQMLERFLFPVHTHGSIIGKLSGGERRRLYLLKLLMEEPNVLLLDEPTNDLDTETLTVLEAFLADFPGVVITVSHDRYFLDKICDQLLIFHGEGNIEKYYGSYSEYLDKLMLQEKNEKKLEDKEKTYVKKDKPTKKKMSYMEKKEWEEIEGKISKTEEKLSSVQAEMLTCGSDFTKLNELMAIEQELNSELERLIERWSYLSELAEESN